jgi:hypothetical protein
MVSLLDKYLMSKKKKKNLEDSDKYVGLGRFGQALLAAGGPSRMPVSFGQGLAAGLGELTDARKQNEEEKLRKAMLGLELEKLKKKQDPKPIKLSAGDILVDPTTNQPVFTAPTRPVKESAAQQKIDRLMTDLGVDRKTAVSIADGAIRVTHDPVSKQPFLVNVATGTTQALTAPGGQKADVIRDKEKPDIGLFELAPKTAGVMSGAAELYSRTLGQIPGVKVPEETLKARQTITAAQNDLVRSMSINPRFPVSEIERIRQEMDIAPSLVDSPVALQARMKALDDYLRTKLGETERDMRDETLPVDTRKAQAQNASAIKTFLIKLGVPQSSTNEEEQQSLDQIFGY